MAAAPCTAAAPAAFRPRRQQSATTILQYGQRIAVISCTFTPFLTKPLKRKNYLRQKLLKMQRKPFVPDDSRKELENRQIQELDSVGNSESGNRETEVLSEVSSSEPLGFIVDGSVGKFDKKFYLKYGFWLVGVFVFQTACAIWVFGSADLDSKKGVLNGNRRIPGLVLGENRPGDSRKKIIWNGGNDGSVVYVDEVEMQRKIEEIRVMAREAREKEKLESNNALNSEDENDVGVRKMVRSDVEEEVDNRLIKLRQKLENERHQMPIASVGRLSNEGNRKKGVEENDLNDTDGNTALKFKKKHKFKDFPSHLSEKPNGFGSTDDYHIHSSTTSGNKNADSGLKSVDGSDDMSSFEVVEKQLNLTGVTKGGDDGLLVVEPDRNKSTVESTKSTKKREKNVEIKQGATSAKPKRTIESGSLEIAEASNKLSKGNGVSKEKRVAINELVKECAGKTQESDTLWWSKLPCVLGIFMYRGHDGADGQGFYTLKDTSGAESHIVAFEDGADATNFCYILQCFFEDLGDFRADAIPLSVKELTEAVKEEDMRVIVVRKGQLHLYAGQPLTEAEKKLRSMVEQG